ncbi:MAG: hypothetical protein ACRDAX_09780 [Propionibacteriaceae bacterium]
MSQCRRFIAAVAAAIGYIAPLAIASQKNSASSSSLEQVVAELKATGLTDMALVLAARERVEQQYEYYSAMSPWESIAVSWRNQRGYSAQYNMALVQVLLGLGFAAEPVFAARIREDTPRPWWRTAHVWVRVWVQERPYEICAGLCDSDGTLRFTPVSQVQPFTRRTRINTAIILTLVAAWQQWRKLFTSESLPEWMYRNFR